MRGRVGQARHSTSERSLSTRKRGHVKPHGGHVTLRFLRAGTLCARINDLWLPEKQKSAAGSLSCEAGRLRLRFSTSMHLQSGVECLQISVCCIQYRLWGAASNSKF